MARPRLLVAPTDALAAFTETGSIRGAARRLRVARSVVARSLIELGVKLPDRRDAYDAVRFLEGIQRPTKTVVRTSRKWGRGRPGDFGVTVVSVVEVVEVVECGWPACEVEAQVGALCRGHARLVSVTKHRRAGGACVWPECPQDARPDGRLCYAHGKRIASDRRQTIRTP